MSRYANVMHWKLLSTHRPTQVDAFIDQICDLETREDPQNSAAMIAEIRTAAKRVTHM